MGRSFPRDSGAAAHLSSALLQPAEAYDLVAQAYDDWKWQNVWSSVEWPEIASLLRAIARIRTINVLIDVGVGTGTFLRRIDTAGFAKRCYGADISQGMLTVARAKLRSRTVGLCYGDVRQLDFPDAFFDVVLLCRVATHIPNIEQPTHEIRRVLRSGGFAIITDIDHRHRYEGTRIPFCGTKVKVCTYKHSLDDWITCTRDFGLRKFYHHLIRPIDLRLTRLARTPSSINFTQDTPISFVLCVQKPWGEHRN
jgi:ubiquinone/menaquinone biosynthesis C-methylase UbiE